MFFTFLPSSLLGCLLFKKCTCGQGSSNTWARECVVQYLRLAEKIKWNLRHRHATEAPPQKMWPHQTGDRTLGLELTNLGTQRFQSLLVGPAKFIHVRASVSFLATQG